MQGRRRPQPSATNRPSSSSPPCPSHPGRRGEGSCFGGPLSGRALLGALCGPQGTDRELPRENAPCWPAAMAGEAHPVPSRTRKLSPLAPMVLRISPWESRTPPPNKGRFHVKGSARLRAARGPVAFPGPARPRAPGARRVREARGALPAHPGPARHRAARGPPASPPGACRAGPSPSRSRAPRGASARVQWPRGRPPGPSVYLGACAASSRPGPFLARLRRGRAISFRLDFGAEVRLIKFI